MLYIPKIGYYLKMLTDDEEKALVIINFGEYFKSMKEKLNSKLSEEQNLRKVAESTKIFLTIPDEVEKYLEMMQSSSSDNCKCHFNVKILNLFDPELQLINTKPIIKEKKEYKVKLIFLLILIVLEYKKKNDHKIFHLSAKLIASNSDNDEASKSMHQSIIRKIKNSASENWVVETIVKHN